MSNPISQHPLSQPETIQLKIVADSAAEAIKTIKERFGGTARVLSVSQQEAGGLKRFLKKPRLEIIVETSRSLYEGRKGPATSSGSKAASSPLPEESEKPRSSESEAPAEVAGANEAVRSGKGSVAGVYANSGAASGAKGYFTDFEGAHVDRASAPLGTAANPVRRGSLETVKRAVSMLKSVGFDDSLVERIRYELDFRSAGDTSAMEIYSRICDWLRKQFPEEREALRGSRRAFIGSCGAGKTAALCKALSADVFVNGLEPIVLKVDTDVPNPSDGLEAFCDIMGASLHRSLPEIDAASLEGRPLYIDMPGLNFGDPRAIAKAKETLDALDVDERVLVVNAAYEVELIAEAMEAGARMGATRVVFTHLDEARRAGKLWKFVLRSGMRPLFFSYGSNPAGDYTMDPFSYLLEKTFPQGRALASVKGARENSNQNQEKREEVAIA